MLSSRRDGEKQTNSNTISKTESTGLDGFRFEETEKEILWKTGFGFLGFFFKTK